MKKNKNQIDNADLENFDNIEPSDFDNIKSDDKVNNNNTIENKQSYTLYIVIDKAVDGLIEYFHGFGIEVSKVFNNIEQARDDLLIQSNKTRLVFIETGSGKFANMHARSCIVDLLGIIDDDIRISMFYTDSIIKSDVEYAKGINMRSIDWMKYRTTVEVLAYLIKLNSDEHYKYDKDIEIKEDNNVDLDIYGLLDNKYNDTDIGGVQISMQDIEANMLNENNRSYVNIAGYKINV